MSKEETYELNLNVQKLDGHGTIPVRVEIKVEKGNIASIRGSGGGKDYEGTLVLKTPSDTESDKLSSDKARIANAESDEEPCIVCDPYCREVSPCPVE
jgi:hypothetical protein